MKAAEISVHAVDHPPWSAKRWAFSILAAFLVQALTLIYLSRHHGEAPPPIPLRTALQLVPDPWSAQQLALWQTYRDPTLFALPNMNSFSGDGWLKFKPMEHHFLDWQESPPWLGLAESDLGGSFHRYIDRAASNPLRITDKPMTPRLGVELLVPNLPMQEESTLRLKGGLAFRQLNTPLRLRSWHSADLLSNTVVRVVTDAGGQIFSVTLIQSSGLPDADRYALNLAQTARFQPRAGDEDPAPTTNSSQSMDWGLMEFQWLTLPPQDGTETLPVTPPPLP